MRRAATLVIAALIALVACGGDDESTTNPAPADIPSQVIIRRVEGRELKFLCFSPPNGFWCYMFEDSGAP